MLKAEQLSIRLALYLSMFATTGRIASNLYFSNVIILLDLVVFLILLAAFVLLERNRIVTEKILNEKDQKINSLISQKREISRLAARLNVHLALQRIRLQFFENILDRADKLNDARLKNDKNEADLQLESIVSMRKILNEFDEKCVSTLKKHFPSSVMSVDAALKVFSQYKPFTVTSADNGEKVSIREHFNLQALEFNTDTRINYTEGGKLELTEVQRMMLQMSLEATEKN